MLFSRGVYLSDTCYLVLLLELKHFERVITKNVLFQIGQLIATRGVADLIESDAAFSRHVSSSLARYITGDWGNVCASDWHTNDNAVKYGERILGSYECSEHPSWKIWIITEWDRSATTILFPDEY